MNLTKTIQYLRPNEEWYLVGEDYAGLNWVSSTTKPTLEELEDAWFELEPKLAWDSVRTERDARLLKSDWTQLADVSLNNKNAWVKYRQSLRDITEDFNSPNDIVWPTEPS